MSLGERVVKAAIGMLLLFVIFTMVMNWVGDYRAASGEGDVPGSESTATVEPTGTAEPATGGEAGAPAPAGESDSAAATAGKTVIVLVDGLNFRVGPTRDSDLIRGLDANEKLDLLAEENGWLKVRDSDNRIGYVSASGSYTRVE